MSRKLNKEIFDVFLSEALRQVDEEELQKSEELFEEDRADNYVPSKRFIRKIKQIYWIHCIGRSMRSKALRRAVSIILTVGIVGGSFIFLAEANDISLYETIFLRQERYTSIETYKRIVSEEDGDSWSQFYFPKYIPADFKVTEKKELENFFYIRFENDDRCFFICQWNNSEDRITLIDTEDSLVMDIEIDGKKGFYSEKEGKQSVYLDMGDISINIYGNIGKKEILRMAENLELLKK